MLQGNSFKFQIYIPEFKNVLKSPLSQRIIINDRLNVGNVSIQWNKKKSSWHQIIHWKFTFIDNYSPKIPILKSPVMKWTLFNSERMNVINTHTHYFKMWWKNKVNHIFSGQLQVSCFSHWKLVPWYLTFKWYWSKSSLFGWECFFYHIQIPVCMSNHRIYLILWRPLISINSWSRILQSPERISNVNTHTFWLSWGNHVQRLSR